MRASTAAANEGSSRAQQPAGSRRVARHPLHLLSISLSASDDFSDVAVLPARLAGLIIPALRGCLVGEKV